LTLLSKLLGKYKETKVNKISAKETEITLDLVEEQMELTPRFDNYRPLTTQEVDKIVRAARLAQSKVAREILYTIVRSVENVFSAIQDGIRAARSYEELSRLSDHSLADIGLNREDIAQMAYLGPESMSAMAELKAYAPLVSVGSYCVVFDTIIEELPKEMYPDRPWGPGNNPKTAVWKYLKTNSEFEIDKSIQNKLLITVASDGYLKKVR